MSGLLRPEASVSLMVISAAIGVLSSWVTADTNSERISATLLFVRATLTAKTSPTASTRAVIAVTPSERYAQTFADVRVGSCEMSASAVQVWYCRSGGGSTAM